MTNGKKSAKHLATAAGAALVGSLALGGVAAQAADNPFGLKELNGGYLQLAMHHEGKCGGEMKCGEGKCGGKAGAEMKCGEGMCGGKASAEMKCGEGMCGGKASAEMKCGEGKCGASR